MHWIERIRPKRGIWDWTRKPRQWLANRRAAKFLRRPSHRDTTVERSATRPDAKKAARRLTAMLDKPVAVPSDVKRLQCREIERHTLARPRPDFTLLEGVERMGALSPDGVRALAEQWARQGRQDERARKLYFACAGVLHQTSPGPAPDSEAMALLRSFMSTADAVDQADLSERILMCSRVRVLNPGLGWPAFELGVGWLKKGDQDQAMRMFEEACQGSILPADIHFLMGNIYIQNRNLDAAAEHLEEAGRGGIDETEIALRLALISIRRGQLDEARHRLHAIREDHRSLAMLGMIYQREKHWHQAESAYLRCLELNGKDLSARLGLARCAEAEGNFDRAEEILGSLAEDTENNAWIVLACGSVAESRGLDDKALQYFRQAVSLDAACVAARVRLGLALYAAQQNLDEAKHHLEIACAGEDADPGALDALASLEAKAGNHEMAVDYWDRSEAGSVAIERAQAASIHELARQALSESRFQDALALWQRLPTSQQDIPEVSSGKRTALECLAASALQRGDWQQALIHADHALELAPADTRLRFWRGLAKYASGMCTGPA